MAGTAYSVFGGLNIKFLHCNLLHLLIFFLVKTNNKFALFRDVRFYKKNELAIFYYLEFDLCYSEIYFSSIFIYIYIEIPK